MKNFSYKWKCPVLFRRDETIVAKNFTGQI
jgi:hypothetical protein